ncbi:MAG: hypothetical protein GTO63_15600 [Anaerolineae bacterium]|nr:hypothetical protein [Anaerolineae bacterium]NIN96254.1 hypothetical protein [Anaerolineae bacterium]NIQ79274.1 hypothetical protein [Anaerolineae bacterium]
MGLPWSSQAALGTEEEAHSQLHHQVSNSYTSFDQVLRMVYGKQLSDRDNLWYLLVGVSHRASADLIHDLDLKCRYSIAAADELFDGVAGEIWSGLTRR